MDLDAFRAAYPEFEATPNYRLARYLDLAATFVTGQRWADSIADYGIGLWVAHHLALAGQPSMGGIKGPAASKAVAGVSVSYNVEAVVLVGGGHWNATRYGVEFLRLARMVGAGPVQLPAGAPAGTVWAPLWG
jgi:hypothetical protein